MADSDAETPGESVPDEPGPTPRPPKAAAPGEPAPSLAGAPPFTERFAHSGGAAGAAATAVPRFALDREAFLLVGLPSLLLMALLLAYGALWFYAAGELRARIDDWFAARRAEGLAAEYRDLAIVGFPYRLQARLGGLAFGDERVAANWRWQSESAVVSLSPFRPDHAVLHLPTEQLFDFAPPARGPGALAERRGFRLAAEAFAASVRFSGGRLARASLDIKALRAPGRRLFEGGEEVPMPGFSAAAIEVHVREAPTVEEAAPPAVDLLLKIAGFAIGDEADGQGAPLRRLDRLEIAGTAKGAPLGVPLQAGLGAPSAFLRAWSERQGTFEIARFALAFAGADLTATGRLSPRPGGHIEGELDASLAGYRGALAAFAEAGALEPEAAEAFARMMDALAAGDGTAEDGRADLPVRFSAGSVFIGPAKVADLPPLY